MASRTVRRWVHSDFQNGGLSVASSGPRGRESHVIAGVETAAQLTSTAGDRNQTRAAGQGSRDGIGCSVI